MFLKVAIFILSLTGLANAQSYKTLTQKTCDGFPQVQVKSISGTCLGLVADATLKDSETNETFRFPRKIVELEPQRFLISDMGGWDPPNRGALWELDLRSNPAKLKKRVSKLVLPHDLEWGPDGELYVGELGKIVRYSKMDLLLDAKIIRKEIVVSGIPTNEQERNLHPLVNFAFERSAQSTWDLYVNVGAPSDACTDDAPRKCSVENKNALIRKYTYMNGLNRWNPEFEIWAKGLRNSMGLLSLENGVLLQVENSRDFRDANKPHDELNVVQKNQHYGWPYCYDQNQVSPEWQGSLQCGSAFTQPFALLAPHSAPLDIIQYKSDKIKALQGKLLISYHGYRPTGSRVISASMNTNGQPSVKRDGVIESSDVIGGWGRLDGIRPQGAPVGILEASDGSLFIVEDKNKTILRLSVSESSNEEPEVEVDNRDAEKVARAVARLKSLPQSMAAYEWINKQVFQMSCQGCHSELQGSKLEAFEFMILKDWIKPGQPDNLLMKRLRGQDGLQKMPLGSSLPEEYINYVESFVKSL